MTLLALSVVRLALLAAYASLVIAGHGWWGVPLLCIFVVGVGCKPPPDVIHPRPMPAKEAGQ